MKHYRGAYWLTRDSTGVPVWGGRSPIRPVPRVIHSRTYIMMYAEKRSDREGKI